MNIEKLQIDPQGTGRNFERFSSGETLSYEAVLCIEEDCRVPVEVHVRQLQIGSRAQLQWILRDISAQISLDNFREDLISMIYHDLRSPLSNIITSLELLQMMVPKDDQAIQTVIDVAERSTDRIQRLTNSLLDIRRIEAGQPAGPYGLAPIHTLVGEAVEAVNTLSRDRNQEIQVALAPDLPGVVLDADMIRRVIINLLENAIKYSPQGSKILLTAQREPGWVQIGVKYQGPGIPPATQDPIFEKFTRLQTKDGLAGLPGGFGLGLAYCRLAVEEQGGRIWVESEPGRGAHFKFVLPVLNDSNEEPEASS